MGVVALPGSAGCEERWLQRAGTRREGKGRWTDERVYGRSDKPTNQTVPKQTFRLSVVEIIACECFFLASRIPPLNSNVVILIMEKLCILNYSTC
jgi:hypothetical protein